MEVISILFKTVCIQREEREKHLACHVSLPWNSIELSTRGHANLCAYRFKKPKYKTIIRIPITIYLIVINLDSVYFIRSRDDF